MLDGSKFLTGGKYPDCTEFDREYERDHIFDLSKASKTIDWDLVDNDNILAAVSGLAAGILERNQNAGDDENTDTGFLREFDRTCIGGGIR